MTKAKLHKKIAFVTSHSYANLTPSDLIAVDTLRAGGAPVAPAVWDDPSVDWKAFSAIVIRSTWDYHLRAERFKQWIATIEKEELPIWNPSRILRWNVDKRYLLDLQGKGIPIPRTSFFQEGDSIDPESVRSQLGTDEVVIKPAVSASGWNTWRCSLKRFSTEDRNKLEELSRTTTMMIQEFMPEIVNDGEWSFVFFGQTFSHAVRKYPGKGDFRVQDELGGHYIYEPNPPANIIREARDVLTMVDAPLLYARVDGIVRAGKLFVIELELLEPSLFFDVYPPAAERFGKRLLELM